MSYPNHSGILALTLLPARLSAEDGSRTRVTKRPLWSEIGHRLSTWRRDERSRRELMNLNDQILQDIGLSRGEAKPDLFKPFWLP